MGMYDDLIYNGKVYQTKDTPSQVLETYEIRDRELWFKKVERVWVETEGDIFGGHLEAVSHEWIFCSDFDGRIVFYDYKYNDDGSLYHEEWDSLFMNGKLLKIKRLK